MDKLQQLLQIISNDTDVLRFKQLEQLIDHNSNVQQTYNHLLSAQKLMVQTEHLDNDRSRNAKKQYEQKYQELLEYPPMQEYLDLIELLNKDLALIQQIIEEELSIDFD